MIDMIALYSRVSTAEQAKEGYSIGEQEQRLADYCNAHGWHDFKHFTDAGYSGGNMNRPALQQILKLIDEKKISRVIVYKLDRLSRSQKDTLNLLEDVFLPNSIDFISLSESIDTGSAFGKAITGILSCFSQLERETIKERISIGREARAKEGKWHGGGNAPIGYDYAKGLLVPNEYEAMQVRECFRLYEAGYSFADIATALKEKGWSHHHGKWTLQRVRNVLKNNLYVGMVKFGGQSFEGIHEPLIDKATFEAVNSMIELKHKTHATRSRSDNALFVGKVYCARCGARFTHYVSITGHKPDNPRISYYACTSRLRKKGDEKCNNKIHRCDGFDAMIFAEMRKLKLKNVKEYREQHEAPDNTKALQRELQKIEKQRSRLIDLYSLGTFSAEELTAKIEPLTASKKAIEEQLATQPSKRSVKDFKDVLDSINIILSEGKPEHIRRLIDILIDRIEIDGDTIDIIWDFD